MKTRLAMKELQRHTEEQPEVVWHQTFWTQCSSEGAPPLACAHMLSKCTIGKRMMSRTACSPWSLLESCFCPSYKNSLPVSHLPPTLQIQTEAAEPFQSPLTGAQTRSSLNPRDHRNIMFRCGIKVYYLLLYLQVSIQKVTCMYVEVGVRLKVVIGDCRGLQFDLVAISANLDRFLRQGFPINKHRQMRLKY